MWEACCSFGSRDAGRVQLPNGARNSSVEWHGLKLIRTYSSIANSLCSLEHVRLARVLPSRPTCVSNVSGLCFRRATCFDYLVTAWSPSLILKQHTSISGEVGIGHQFSCYDHYSTAETTLFQEAGTHATQTHDAESCCWMCALCLCCASKLRLLMGAQHDTAMLI
jgi:hypothetical protein